MSLALVLAWIMPLRAANFDDFKPGAKAMGMGMAYSAVADDPYALFFNPAGTANTPYSQAGFSVGRLDSPIGALSEAALVYLRPFEPVNTGTVGAAFYTDRQTKGGDKDEFLFHYAQEVKLPQFLLTKPLKIGTNFKFLSVTDDRGGGGSSLFGIGGDVGALARSGFGLSGSFVVQDLITNIGTPRAKLNLGLAYLWQKWLLVAGDLRVSGVTDFYTGLEAAFYQGLLKVRAGRGFQLDGVSQFAWGFGVNFSPVILDVAMTIPTNGIHRRAGSYQMSFNYRFGAPSFSGSFVGAAASQAETLKTQIEKLAERKKTLEAESKAAEERSEITEKSLETLTTLHRELEDDLRQLQKRRDDVDFSLRQSDAAREAQTAPKPPPPQIRPLPPPPAPRVKKTSWPQRHVVKPGETLRSLAKTFYDDANLWETIYQANRDKVERGLPLEGAEFVIPAPPRP